MYKLQQSIDRLKEYRAAIRKTIKGIAKAKGGAVLISSVMDDLSKELDRLHDETDKLENELK